MRLRRQSTTFLAALLISTAAPLIVNLSVISLSMEVLAETKDSRKQKADRLIEQGNKQLDTSQFQAALSLYQQALKIYQSIGDRNGEGDSLGNLGVVYRSLGEYKKAINYHQQSLEIKRQLGDRNGEGNSLGNLGLVYDSLGEYKKAINYHQQSLEIKRQLGDRNGERKSLNNLGNVYDSLGEYKKAIDYHQQSLEISRQLGDRNGEGNSLGNLGLVYDSLGEYKKAINYHQQSLEIKRQLGDRNGEGNSLNNLGNVYDSLGEYKKAIDYHQQSLEISRQLGDRNGEGKSLGNLGLVYDSLGEYKKAINYHQQSLEIKRQLGDRNGEGNSLNNLGNVYDSLGEYKKAIDYDQQSLEISRQLGDRNGEGISLNNLGNVYLNSRQPKQAEEYLREAIKVWESQRSLLDNNHGLKVSFFDTQAGSYRLLQQALIEQQRDKEALEIAERGRARAFTELIVEKQELSSSPPPNIEQIRSVAKQQNATIVYYSIAWDDLYIWLVKPTGKIVFHQADLKDKKLREFAEDARTAASTIGESPSPQRGFANDLITSLVGKTRSAVDKPVETPSSSTNKVRSLNCRGNVCLQQMYNLLIQPIAKELPKNPKERVIFVPHESLFLIPFAALQDEKDEKFLIEKHTISIAPSVQVLQLTYQKKQALNQDANNSMVVVGNPTMPKVAPSIGEPPEQLEPLPEAEKEAKEIARMYNTQPLIGNQATKAVVTKQMGDARYIHLATHGLLDNLDQDGIPGTIALAPSGKDDGLLSANQVLNMNLKADLVVLSACETGRGKITGDGVIGLPRAFISAGTPSIMVSLWQVSDESTAFFMTEFYRQLKADDNSDNNPDNNKAQALRQAMLKTMKKYPETKDWSAFLLIGEAE